MWVTQSYLGVVEPDAQLFVYYLFEENSDEQTAFTEQVQRGLEELGEIHGDSVSLLVPNKRYTARIESEVRGIQDFWFTLRGRLPGLLLSSKPLSRFDPSAGEFYLIEFKTMDGKGAAEAISRLRQLINEQLVYQFENRPQKRDETLWTRLVDALELKPGAWGVKLDLKKLAKL
jgi:hypothetical protein